MSTSVRAQLHAPFHSRRGRVVGWSAVALQGVAFLVAALILPWGGQHPTSWYDRAGFIVVAALIGWFLSRLATVAAYPAESGLVVRNLLLTRTLEWAQIVGLRFTNGDPWVILDLSDGDTLAVMAIQRADGKAGRAEATRLATLLALHGPPAGD